MIEIEKNNEIKPIIPPVFDTVRNIALEPLYISLLSIQTIVLIGNSISNSISILLTDSKSFGINFIFFF